MTYLIRALVGVVMVAACSSVAEAAGSHPLQPQDIMGMVQIGGSMPSQVRISPDGRYVAYAEANPAGAAVGASFDPLGPGRKSVWIVDTRSSSIHCISDLRADAWSPSWSPNSKKIAFYVANGGRTRLLIWDMRTARRLSTGVPVASIEEGYGAPVSALWTNDSEHVIVPQTVNSSPKPKATEASKPNAIPAITEFRSTPPPAESAHSGDVVTAGLFRGTSPLNLALFDVASSRTRLIPTRAGLTGLKLSPDGARALYLIDRGEIDSDVNSREIFDVAIVDLRSGASRIVARNILANYHGSTMSWSHDGSKIAFIGGLVSGDADVTTADHGSSFPGHMYLIDVTSTAAPRRVASDLFAREEGPVSWSLDDSTLYAVDEAHSTIEAISIASGLPRYSFSLADGRFVGYPELVMRAGTRNYVLAIANDGERRVYDMNLDTGTMTIVLHAYQSISSLTFAESGSTAAYIGQDPRRPQDIWVAEDGMKKPHELTHLNPRIESHDLGDPQSVSWVTHDGARLNGTLLLPAGYQAGKRYPTITWVYGGEPEGTNSRTVFGLSMTSQAPYFNLQLLASHGYAVFVPDSVLRVGTPMADIATAVLPGIDRVVAMGIADPNRLGVYGQSYGGYSTLALLVQSDRFKAAVAMSGIDDMFAMYGTMYEDGSDWTSFSESQQGRMGGTPWDQRQRYIDNSPFFFLDKVHTPVLLEYGTDDRFAAIDWEQAFVSLRRLGRTATLVRYAGEGHVLSKPSNQLDLCRRILNWFDGYLKAGQE